MYFCIICGVEENICVESNDCNFSCSVIPLPLESNEGFSIHNGLLEQSLN